MILLGYYHSVFNAYVTSEPEAAFQQMRTKKSRPDYSARAEALYHVLCAMQIFSITNKFFSVFDIILLAYLLACIPKFKLISLFLHQPWISSKTAGSRADALSMIVSFEFLFNYQLQNNHCLVKSVA